MQKWTLVINIAYSFRKLFVIVSDPLVVCRKYYFLILNGNGKFAVEYYAYPLSIQVQYNCRSF